jgi:hypothetical protein
VFRRLMNDEETFLRISPTLFFEILLRKVTNDLKGISYTVEKTSAMKIPVFDTGEVVELLSKESLVDYLAHMLSSFTKIENYTVQFKTKTGIWERIRFNDLDIFCLFILGIFPDYAEREYRYPFSRQVRPRFHGKGRIRPEEYEREGRNFYKLAAKHKSAKELGLSDVFWALHENFEKAKKPLNFIGEYYLQYRRDKLFF